MTGSYKQLRVWQDAMSLAAHVYAATDKFPQREIYWLTGQIRRAAVSVPSNIAEGKGHRSNLEFSHFLFHARGSLLELETQLMLAGQLQYLCEHDLNGLLVETGALARSLNALINSIEPKSRRAARPTAND